MSDEVSGIMAIQFHIDQTGNLTTATPVDMPIAGGVYHKTFKMPQAGCLRGILSRIEQTPNTSNPDLVTQLTIGGVESTTGLVNIAIGATENEATFYNGEVALAKDDEVGVSIEMTGGTIDDAVEEVVAILIIQLGSSNI